MASAAPDPPADGVYLAGRHAAQVLAAHQAMARIRQAMMRPDLAPALLADALGVLESAASPVHPPRSAPGDGPQPLAGERLERRRAYLREYGRAYRARRAAAD